MSADRSKHPIVHFVGSIPLPDSETVFRTLSAAGFLAAAERMRSVADRTGLVGVAQDHTAKDRPVRVRVSRSEERQCHTLGMGNLLPWRRLSDQGGQVRHGLARLGDGRRRPVHVQQSTARTGAGVPVDEQSVLT